MDTFLLFPSLDLTLHSLIVVLSLGLIAFGILNISFPKNALSLLYYYGKTIEKPDQKSKSLSNFLQVPKRWFPHFYINSVIQSSFVLWMVWTVYFGAGECPAAVQKILFWFSSPDSRHATVAPQSVTIATALVFCQMIKRLYECLYISIFSDGHMSILHYIYGIIFYTILCITLLIEAPGFIEPCRRGSCVLQLSTGHWLAVHHIVGALLAIFGSYMQWQSNKVLASLRKNKKGEIVTHQHKVPYGGWFEWVSNPHFLGEILFYLGVNIVFGGTNTTFYALFVNVLVNQVLTADTSHVWYKKNFPNYPKNRKALFPFVF